jgi:nucleoside-diphosphate-sugar epimerase
MNFHNRSSKIVLTGGSGFLGTHLLKNEALKDALAIGRTKPLNHANFIQIDSTDDNKLEDILFGKEVVIHLAARAHIMNDKTLNPQREYTKVNTKETLNLARRAAVSGIKRFIFISSVKVLGEKSISGHFFKNDDLLSPQDPYSISKAGAEKGLKEIGKSHGMEIVIIRPPLIYGNGVKGNFRLLLKLIKIPVPLPFGSIKNKRSLVSIDNLVDLIVTCINHPKASNETFMVSDGYDLSTPELLSKLANAGNYKIFLFRFPEIFLYLFLRVIGKLAIYERLCGSMRVDI